MSRRAGLDTAAVVHAAAVIADAEGLEALTIARLAEQLGVRPPSLYNHVAGLDGLRRALALMGLQELHTRMSRAAIGKTTDAAVLAVAQTYREFVREHPGVYATTVQPTAATDAQGEALQVVAQQVVDVVLAVVMSYDVTGDDALHAVRGLRSVVHGFATLEVAGGFGLALDYDDSFQRLIRTFIAGLQQHTMQSASSV